MVHNNQLSELVQRTITEHPLVGQSFVWGVIRSQGFQVTRECVRQMLRRCDPVGTASRWQGLATPRQPYSVPGPNSLWHIGLYVVIHTSVICSSMWYSLPSCTTHLHVPMNSVVFVKILTIIFNSL